MDSKTEELRMEGIAVSPLASPKGVKYECEMCGKIACIKCKSCGVTFYCSPEHQRIDWDGIHHKICHVLQKIRSPANIGSERERAKREHIKEKAMLSIIEISKSEAMRNLVSNHFELAMAGALQAQRHSMEIFGANRVELVPAYLLLAEASMGLEHHRQAEGYLSKAKYNVLKHPDCPNILRSRLHRACGRLYLVTGRRDEALQELANDIFYSSIDAGPEHIDTAPGYFHMANAFRICKKDDIASAMYEKVVDIWYSFLSRALQHMASQNEREQQQREREEQGGAPEGQAAGGKEDDAQAGQKKKEEFVLEETQIAETLDILTRILHHREEHYGKESPLTANLHRALGMLYIYANAPKEARQHLVKAHEIYHDVLGEEDPNFLAVRHIIEIFPLS